MSLRTPDYGKQPSSSEGEPWYLEDGQRKLLHPPLSQSNSAGSSWRDKFDADPTNGDWRDDLLVIVGVLCLLAFFSVIALARLAHHDDVLFYVGITLLVLGIYVRVAGKRGR